MKKVISVVLVLFALGVATFFFLKVRRYLPERPRGTELAPADTMFFAQFPNLRQTAVRIPQSDLYQIWREPDVQTFLEKPRLKAPWMRAWTERIDEILRVAPGELFVAFTSIDGPRPSFVCGFSFAGSQRNAESLATHLREQLFPGAQVVSSLRSNWYLCASDSGLLGAMQARFDGKPGETLAATPRFQHSIAPLGVGQDLVLFGKPAALAGRLDLLTGFGGQAKPLAEDVVAMGTKIDGAKMHDTIFLSGSGPAKSGSLSRQTLSLASARALLYYAADLSLVDLGPDSNSLKNLVPALAGMEKSLAEKGLSWSDVPVAIGPELGLIAEWPEDAALPALLFASDVRDPAKARGFMDAMTHPPAPSPAWQGEEHDGVTVWNSPAQGTAFVRPAAALTDRFALLGMSAEAVAGALSTTTPTAGPSLGKSEPFQDVARFVPAQASAFGYLDFQRLFERVYRMARPFITLSLAFSANTGAQFDAGKLPPVESIAKHLSATVLIQTKIDGGTVIESVGSLTLPEILLGVGAGSAGVGLPNLTGVKPVSATRPLPRKPMGQSTAPTGPGGGAALPAAEPSDTERIGPNHK